MNIVLLLGRGDVPTDAVADYAGFLAGAVRQRDVRVEVARVPWTSGPTARWRWLMGASRKWRNCWVVVQYTALGWSRRGFPLDMVAVLLVLRFRGCRIAVTYHDSAPFPARPDAPFALRVVDAVRRWSQRTVTHLCHRSAQLSVYTVPMPLAAHAQLVQRHVVIPVGSNIFTGCAVELPQSMSETPTVAVFSVTGGGALQSEAEEIAEVVSVAAAGRALRLLLLGRNALEAEPYVRARLHGANVELEVHGVLPAADIRQRLSGADALLFVRGQVSSRRGSAIAAMSCGVPVVGYAGSDTGPPLTDAGVVTVPSGRRRALASALAIVLDDSSLRARLRTMNADVYARHFAWDVIADRYLCALRNA